MRTPCTNASAMTRRCSRRRAVVMPQGDRGGPPPTLVNYCPGCRRKCLEQAAFWEHKRGCARHQKRKKTRPTVEPSQQGHVILVVQPNRRGVSRGTQTSRRSRAI